MNFYEQYKLTKQWQNKVTIMELYHLTMIAKMPNWNVNHTAMYFNCSIGLASENLRLAELMHNRPEISNCQTRQEAIQQLVTRK